ncbi:MAG: XrtA/PEP-CTERM system TPR-repeat protein PrsT [Nitrosomonas sp.]
MAITNYYKGTTKKKFTTVLVLILLILTTITACGKAKDADALISEAKQYHEKGDDKAAIIQLKNALQQKPDDREARHLLGAIYNRTGDVRSAEKELSRALSLGMDPARVLPDLGQALLSLGEFQQVLDKTETLPEDVDFAEILTLRGNALLGLGRFQEAKELFDQALQDKPDFPDAFIGLARHALSQKDVETAMRFLEEVTTKFPDNTNALIFKGDLLRAQGKNDLALDVYGQAIKARPDQVTGYVNRASVLIGLGKFDSAQQDLNTASKIAPGNLLIAFNQALLDFTQGKHAVALDALQKILSSAPNHMPSVLIAAASHFALGSVLQAEQLVNQYLKVIPNNLYAIKLKASILLKNHAAKQAIDLLTPALKSAQQDPQLLALAGESYMQSKDFDKATEFFEKANALLPESAALHTALALSKLGQGNRESAIAELEVAANLDEQSPRAGVLLVMTHLQTKDFNKALKAVEELEKEQVDSPLVQNLKGSIYVGMQDLAKARASFEKALTLKQDYFPAISNLARLDVQENNLERAKNRFEDVLKRDKKHIQAMHALAGIALTQNNKNEAITWFERASNENPNELQPALQLGALYVRLQEGNKALSLAKKLQGSYPDNLSVVELLAQAQLAVNDRVAALENYQKLAARLPDSAAAQFQLANVQALLQNQKAAAEAVKKAIALKPDYLEANLLQARLEIQNNKPDEAMKIAKAIQKQHAKLPVGFELEGDLLMSQKKAAQAIGAYEKAFSLNQSSQLMIKQYAALSQGGKEKQANERITKWLEQHPTDASTRLFLGGVHLEKKQFDAAIKQFQMASEQNPDNPIILNNLAWTYQQLKDPSALDYAEKAYKNAPESPAILDTLGWILVEKGEIARAVSLLQKAVSLAPEAAEIRYHLAVSLQKSGDKGAARQELEHLLASGKAFSKIDDAKKLLKDLEKD